MKRIVACLLALIASVSLLMLISAEEIMPFDDVNESHWFYEDVSKVWEYGIMDGKSPTVFAPRTLMTRAELVTMLARIADSDLGGLAEYAAAQFNDVGVESWYAPYVGWGASAGIVTGYSNGTFLPNNPVSRQELAVMMVRFMDLECITYKIGTPLVDAFADRSSIGSWARSQVETLRNAGIIGGDENGNFNPKMSATRAEVAAIVRRYHDFSVSYFNDFAPEGISLECSVEVDFTINAEFITGVLNSSGINMLAYDSVEIMKIDELVSHLNETNPDTYNIDIDIVFTRADVVCTGEYVLIFTREAQEPPADTSEAVTEEIIG